METKNKSGIGIMEIPNRDKQREQMIKNSLEETKEEIINIEVTIQKLNELKDRAVSNISIINQELNKPIQKLKEQKEFLEDIYDSDKQALFLMMTDEERHQAINNKVCCVCGGKLSCSCYAEDSYSVECLGCNVLYFE